MFVIAVALFLLAVGGCVLVIRRTSRALGVGADDALIWLGLAEAPLPPAPPRRRPRG